MTSIIRTIKNSVQGQLAQGDTEGKWVTAGATRTARARAGERHVPPRGGEDDCEEDLLPAQGRPPAQPHAGGCEEALPRVRAAAPGGRRPVRRLGLPRRLRG